MEITVTYKEDGQEYSRTLIGDKGLKEFQEFQKKNEVIDFKIKA